MRQLREELEELASTRSADLVLQEDPGHGAALHRLSEVWAAGAVATEVEEQVPTTVERPPLVDRELVAQLVGDAERLGLGVDGEDGLLAQLTKLVLESALQGELTAHLGYDKHERVEGGVNARNGTRTKTVLTKAGPVQIDVPRDRAGTFEPVIVAKRQRRLGSIEDVVLSLSARGMTHGDISAHLADVYGSEVSKTTISTITDTVLEGMAEWQNRPLDPVYPVLFIDSRPRQGPRRAGREPPDLHRPGGHRRGEPGHPGAVDR